MLSKNKVKYLHSLQLKKNRKTEGVFVAEGAKLVGELLGHFPCRYVCMTEDCALTIPSGCECDIITDEELRRVSTLECPQQILAVFSQPVYTASIADIAPQELVIALDEVQNPGNLGTIIRLADWFGIRHIFCSQVCADVFNPKTVQATMGGLARIQVHYCNLAEELAKLRNTPIYGTFLDGDSIYKQSLSASGVIVMGNEGRGVSTDVAALVTHRLLIPNYPEGTQTTESLNVAIATAVVCAEFRRPR